MIWILFLRIHPSVKPFTRLLEIPNKDVGSFKGKTAREQRKSICVSSSVMLSMMQAPFQVASELLFPALGRESQTNLQSITFNNCLQSYLKGEQLIAYCYISKITVLSRCVEVKGITYRSKKEHKH